MEDKRARRMSEQLAGAQFRCINEQLYTRPSAEAVQLFAEERQDLRGGSYYWYGFTGELSNPPEGTDLRAIYDGRISITPLHLSLPDVEARTALAKTIAARGEKA